MEFINNSISSGLNGSIYVSSLNVCHFQFQDQNFSLLQIFCSGSWSYKESNCTEQIITGPASITNYTTFNAIPGKNTFIPVSVYDELHHDISEITPIVYVSDGHRFIYTDFASYTQTSTLLVKPWYVSFMPQKPKIEETIRLWTVADQTVTLNLIVDIDNCPPGFYYTGSPPNGVGQCICVQNQPFMICLSAWYSNNNEIRLKQGWFMTYDEGNNDVYVATQQLYQPTPLEGDNKNFKIRYLTAK